MATQSQTGVEYVGACGDEDKVPCGCSQEVEDIIKFNKCQLT